MRVIGNSKNYHISKTKNFEDIITEKGHCYFEKVILIRYWAEINCSQNGNVGK